MRKFQQKWVIVQFLEPIHDGLTFSGKDWPLHVTIVSNFTINLRGDELFEKLADLLKLQKSTKVRAEKIDYFGPNKDIRVTVLEKNKKLQQLHSTIANFLDSQGAVFDEPQYLYEGYGAHSTVQKNSQLNIGDVVNIGGLTIVDMFPDDDGLMRRVLKTIRIG